MAHNFTFQSVSSQWYVTILFLTRPTTTLSFGFLDNYIFNKIKTQLHTSYQGQAPSHMAESRSCYWQWYKNSGNKDAMFTATFRV